MVAFSIACLLITGLSCAAGVLSHRFDDNLLQRLGLGFLCFACAARAYDLMQAGYVSPISQLFHIGCALIALGSVSRALGLGVRLELKLAELADRVAHAGERR